MHKFVIKREGRQLEKASKAMILLHGRGSTAENILSLGNVFCDESFYIAAPQAANQTWYPHSFLVEESLNEPWLSSAVEVVKRLIDETSKHIPRERIYIMGFSQGACLALEVTARFAAKYGGVAAFSGGLIGKSIDEKKYHGDFEKTKVFIGVSDHDPHIPLERTEESKRILEKFGAEVTLKVYRGTDHTVRQDEIDCVKKLYGLKSKK